MHIDELARLMKDCGIVGAGGAGFPSYAKLSEAADTIVLNCAECEPLFRLHRQLLSDYAEEIMTALETVRCAVGAERAIIAIKPSYTAAIESVEEKLDRFKSMRISKLPEIYPAGDEIVTIYETTGRIVKPGKLPISEGVIVYNVETMLNTYYALTEKRAVTAKYVTVAGEVGSPRTFRVPIGTPLARLVEAAGGETQENCTWLSGGAMTGRIANKTDCVVKTTNAVLVLPENHSVIMKKKTNAKVNIYRAMSSCCQCRMCTDLCSRNLLGYPIKPHAFMRAAAKGMTADIEAMTDTMYCSQCRLCEMYACQQGLSPAMLIGIARGELRKNGVKPSGEPGFTGVNPQREYRKVPMGRLIARLGIEKYDVEAPFEEFKPKDKKLKIMLSQHIGQPAKPICGKGDEVKANDKIARCEGLGADIHSPADGIVRDLTDKYIIIETKR